MRKSILPFILLVAFQLFAVDKTLITVKDSAVSNGMVFVTIQESGKSYWLQCTATVMNCSNPKPGSYWMVRLPKNRGLYDCSNVDLYLQSADPEAGGEVFGEYCISEK